MTVLINAEETFDKIQHPFCIKKKRKQQQKQKALSKVENQGKKPPL